MTYSSAGVTADRTVRTLGAVGAVGWAYLSAQYRGDWVRASQLLSLFQQLYNANSATVIREVRGDYPTRVSVTGRFDSETRWALIAGIMGGFPTPLRFEQIASMPESAGQVGSWFWRELAPRIDIVTSGAGTNLFWDIDRLARETRPEQVSAVVGAELRSFIEGRANTPPPAPSTTASSFMDNVLRTRNAAAPTQEVVALGPTDGELITAVRPVGRQFPMWGWAIVGVGALALFAWFGAGLAKRRRRRR